MEDLKRSWYVYLIFFSLFFLGELRILFYLGWLKYIKYRSGLWLISSYCYLTMPVLQMNNLAHKSLLFEDIFNFSTSKLTLRLQFHVRQQPIYFWLSPESFRCSSTICPLHIYCFYLKKFWLIDFKYLLAWNFIQWLNYLASRWT